MRRVKKCLSPMPMYSSDVMCHCGVAKNRTIWEKR